MLKLVTPHVLIGVEFDTFAIVTKTIKDTIRSCISYRTIHQAHFFGGSKVHDYHVLMQFVFAIGIEKVDGSKTSRGSHEDFKGIQKALQQGLESFIY
jgi:hypothetical protein